MIWNIYNAFNQRLREIPSHFIHEIKTTGYKVIGVNVFLRKLKGFLRKKESIRRALYYCCKTTEIYKDMGALRARQNKRFISKQRNHKLHILSNISSFFRLEIDTYLWAKFCSCCIFKNAHISAVLEAIWTTF